ncbi:LysM peptidoglycan-binding domain-containing protein [Sagittula sp. SSi028]|uniref:LysM peptidoglycan-binding domain-containing protein n=1 Tax=Sagittula sp. SSi028 TaxID=3400636 RepID=UPI003AF57EAA
MIRMVLFALGFLAITVALLVIQPGAPRERAERPAGEAVVTRAQPALTDIATEPKPEIIAPLVEPEDTKVALPPRSTPAPIASAVDLDDQELRRMTWNTLSSLNQATGRAHAPGEPGSLLHTIVQRSLGDGDGATVAARAIPDSYTVRAGDSLVSIAEAVYGDVNMTGPLFAANQSVLAQPNDLRAGQVLSLPRP